MRTTIINFLLFQISWFACVVGAAKHMPWLGVMVVLACIIWHLIQSTHAKNELILLIIAVFIGGLFDQIMLSTGQIVYQSHGWSHALVPSWILALWLSFTTTLNLSLRWMRGKTLIAIAFGMIGGPLAYLAAEKLGAVTLNNAPVHFFALALGWAVLTPALLKLSERFDGFRP